MIPFFLTGANAKIRVNGKTMAFCTDVSYSIKVNHVAPKVLGMYEAHSVEPISYEVTGSFSIIKYVSGMADLHGSGHDGSVPDGVQKTGNGIGAWGPSGYHGITGNLNNPNDGMAHQSMTPKSYKDSVMFDIEIFQKAPCGNDNLVAKVRNVRIIQNDFQLTKKGVAMHRYQFMANYVDEDTFDADFSGVGQNLGVG